MKEAIEISTGKHLETMEEINESNSALECPICHLPLTRVHDLDSVGHLAHPPYSRLYMPELCPNMDPNFSKGASSSYGTISYNWNLKHVLKQLELNSKGESILKAVFDSIAHERQNYIALTAKAAHTIKHPGLFMSFQKVKRGTQGERYESSTRICYREIIRKYGRSK